MCDEKEPKNLLSDLEIPVDMGEFALFAKSTTVRVIDALMGTGKSTWVIMQMKAHPKNNFIVVLPFLSELKRYEDELKGVNGVVSLFEEGQSKTRRFKDALTNDRIILITHTLFESYLTEPDFELLQIRKWNLIMDETITAFKPVNVDQPSIDGLKAKGVLNVRKVIDNLELLEPDHDKSREYLRKSDYNVYPNTKEFIKSALAKDLYCTIKGSPEQKRFYCLALKPHRLLAFHTVMILTYPFKETDLDYWFQMKKTPVKHLELIRNGNTESLSDFKLVAHSGTYSGKAFKHLINFLEPSRRSGPKQYGQVNSHFSSKAMKTIFNPETKDRKSLNIQHEVRKSLINIFRNPRQPKVGPDDFMFTCGKSSIKAFQDSQNGLSEKFVGEESTFVPFNERAKNDKRRKHYLAYLYNVYPFPTVEQRVRVAGITYNRARCSLYILIQWIWRSAIRKDEEIFIYIPSKRMRDILEEWLNS